MSFVASGCVIVFCFLFFFSKVVGGWWLSEFCG